MFVVLCSSTYEFNQQSSKEAKMRYINDLKQDMFDGISPQSYKMIELCYSDFVHILYVIT